MEDIGFQEEKGKDMRLDIERQRLLEPTRIEKAVAEITKLGYKIDYQTDTEVGFTFNGDRVKFWPYSGWHTGKTIKDGRGLSKLIRQIKR
jgi:hypothetical protein